MSLHTICWKHMKSIRFLRMVGPQMSNDEQEKMSTILPHCLPRPVTGVPSPCSFKGIHLD